MSGFLTPKLWLAIAMMMVGIAVSWAGPDDDFRAGETAYQTGDVSGAMQFLRRAADAGHASAQVLLADILDKAELNEEAIIYYRRAAAQGSAEGEFGLGNMYATGEGVDRDLKQARIWYQRAAEKNHPQAINVLAQAYIQGGLGMNDKDRHDEQAVIWIKRAAGDNYLPAIDFLAKAYRMGMPGVPADIKTAELMEAKAVALRVPKAAASKGEKR
jgi:tetratricopeptide (TPR) repeat protein